MHAAVCITVLVLANKRTSNRTPSMSAWHRVCMTVIAHSLAGITQSKAPLFHSLLCTARFGQCERDQRFLTKDGHGWSHQSLVLPICASQAHNETLLHL